jgi:hypothetical protein
MSTLPTAYRQIIDPLIDVARAILERGERLVPVAFVGNLTTGETHQVMMSAASDPAKDDSAELVRHLASSHQADFVFVSIDAWCEGGRGTGAWRVALTRRGYDSPG